MRSWKSWAMCGATTTSSYNCSTDLVKAGVHPCPLAPLLHDKGPLGWHPRGLSMQVLAPCATAVTLVTPVANNVVVGRHSMEN